jgi:protoporphyrinogen oxidase
MSQPVVVIGAGFTGLAAGYELARRGLPVVVLERDSHLGGLAANFDIDGRPVERFYHHFFNHDRYLLDLIDELGCSDRVHVGPTATAIYIGGRFFRLSGPADLLRFTALSMADRIRLGMLVLKVRQVKDWQQLDGITAQDWLTDLCGRRVYETVWQPLLRGKFGSHADQIAATWIWSKLVLRGGSRNKAGSEALAYYQGGFGSLADTLAVHIEAAGGKVLTSSPAQSLVVEDGCVKGVRTPSGLIETGKVVATPALPLIADLLRPHVSAEYVRQLSAIRYLGNMCIVLELSRKLSDIYWLNVAEPDFPFVGIIEHTNFQPPADYGDRHIVYLSKYLDTSSDAYRMNAQDSLTLSLACVKRMFPEFSESALMRYHIWKAPYAQPVTSCGYSRLIPDRNTPLKGFHIATMSQIYPEDRGVNYAVRDGRRIANIVTGMAADSEP